MSDPIQQEKRQRELEEVKTLQGLFSGLKFYLGREIPRDAVTFIIRSVGGQVSFDKSIDAGATYDESDETITHQIVDRPHASKTYMSRFYIQPQWVFDCVNARRLLPADDYFADAILPPHLSPFVEEGEGDYMPPEKRRLLGLESGETGVGAEEDEMEASDEEDAVQDDVEESSNEEDDKDGDEESEEREESEGVSDVEEEVVRKKAKKEEEKVDTKASTKSQIVSGTVQKVDVGKVKKKQQDEEKKLTEMMIPKKNRRLYKKIQHLNKKKAQETRVLTEKREKHEKLQKKTKRAKLGK
jgi:pescadillo protein